MNLTVCQKQGLGIASGRVAVPVNGEAFINHPIFAQRIRNNLAFAFFSHFSIILYKVSLTNSRSWICPIMN